MAYYRGFLRLLLGTSLALIQRRLQEKQAKYEGKNQPRVEAILMHLAMKAVFSRRKTAFH